MRKLIIVFILLCVILPLSAKEKGDSLKLPMRISVFGEIDFTLPNISSSLIENFCDDGAGYGIAIGYDVGSFGIDLSLNSYMDYYEGDDLPFQLIYNKIYIENTIYSIRPRYYFKNFYSNNFVGLFISPSIGVETVKAKATIRKYNNQTHEFDIYKESVTDTSLTHWGVRIGGVGNLGGVYLEGFVGFNNLHLHRTMNRLDTEKYGLATIKGRGFSSLLELGMALRVPLFSRKVNNQKYINE